MKFLKTSLSGSLLALLSLVLLASCNYMDDQTIITPERIKFANPDATPRNFKRINSQHKVLIGIIDTGIDYNHPLLKENIHFNLDSTGQVQGFGYDLSGEDEWASPYIARTSDYNPNMDAENKKQSLNEYKNIENLLTEVPEFSLFLSPERNIGQELASSAYHGTHVAGLASYDTPEIGILGYRAIPFSLKFQSGMPMQKGDEELVEQILSAAQYAIDDGARVLNMSLGQFTQKEYHDLKKDEDEQKKHLLRVAKVREFAINHPNVVIVVAAGNEGQWIDQNTRVGMPCGTEAPNIICVGAMDEAGNIASFSNVLMTEGAFILGLGVKILSTMPTAMCHAESMSSFVKQDNSFSDHATKLKLIEALKKDCKNLGLKELSGTSMASPIIAREVGKIFIENPRFSGAEAIQALISRSETYNFGKISFPKLKVEKPSWYAKKSDGISLRRNSSQWDLNEYLNEKEYFEFVIPSN